MIRKTNLQSIFSILLTMSFVLTFAIFSLAQSGTSGINGNVKDQNGAVIPGAVVKITSNNTGFTRSSTTDEDGNYQFPGIPPGAYKVDVEKSGFTKKSISNAQASVDLPLRLNVTLDTGNVSVTVDVSAGEITSIANTQDASTGNNFVPEQITQLPTDLRRVNDLLTLQPSVTREGYVAGGRSDQANITLDGVDINDQQTGGRGNALQTSQDSVLRATTESVEEFRITTTNANANQGRSSGAQISLITKTGTNKFRGAAFYFLRPTALSANDFFNNMSGLKRPELTRHVFGGAIGGPIKKDKLFFFYSFEGQRQTLGTPVTQIVPLASLGRGEIKFFGAAPGDPAGTNRLITLTMAQLNSVYTIAGINPVAVSALGAAASRYVSNDSSVGDGLNTGGFRFNSPTTTAENTHIARFDYNMSATQSLFLRANYQSDILKQSSAFPDTPSTSFWDHPYGFVVGHNWTIGSNKVNNFRYGYTRQAFSNQGDSSANAISFRFVYSPAAFSRTLSRITPTQNFTDDFTWIKGGHTIQMGTNIRVVRNIRSDFGGAYDSATTNPSFYQGSGSVLVTPFTAAGYTVSGGSRSSLQAAATALIGRYSQYQANYTFNLDGTVAKAGSAADRTFATEEYDFYGQDVWKPFKDLTLTLGLRYGVSRPVYEKNGFQVVPDTALGDVFARRIASANKGLPDNSLVQFVKAGPKNCRSLGA
jgi:Carboxypeptidase regulatory-like domain